MCLLLCLTPKSPRTKPEPFDFSKKIRVYDPKTDTVTEMPFDQYICFCLAGEMPASFHTEALKAQAVAIRSYVCRKAVSGSHPKNADVCTDFSHCAAFKTDFDTLPEETKQIYKDAVAQTPNEVLYYKEEIANTVFHAMSGGKTESAENVWGSSVPYLLSVESGLDKTVAEFETIVSFTHQALQEKLGIQTVTVGTPAYNQGGTVKTLQIGEKIFTGREIREKLGLRSAYFTATPTETEVIFTVHGYGHGVGMSQEGANAYAKEGLTYTEILAKYYPKTTLCRLY